MFIIFLFGPIACPELVSGESRISIQIAIGTSHFVTLSPCSISYVYNKIFNGHIACPENRENALIPIFIGTFLYVRTFLMGILLGVLGLKEMSLTRLRKESFFDSKFLLNQNPPIDRISRTSYPRCFIRNQEQGQESNIFRAS